MAWKPLHLSANAGTHLPPLLISATFDAASYSIYLTDLTQIWSEVLTRKAIMARSQEENTSIDPSDGDQLSILLKKIRLGLEGGKDTTLAFSVKAEADRPSLVLNVTTKLPGGLAPLEWPVRLAPSPPSLLTCQLTLPMLRAQHARMQEMTALMELLQEKDHVIQKLLDKLEDQNTELGEMFPQAAAKAGRKVDRKKAEERVRGLGLFHKNLWRQGLCHEEIQDTAQLIGSIFAGEIVGGVDAGRIIPLDEDTWWMNLKGVTVDLESGRISTRGVPKAKSLRRSPKPALPQEDSIDEDAFQVQKTPQLASTSNPATSHTVIGDSTGDEDDLDAPSQRSNIPDSFPSSQPPISPLPTKAKKLGILGGKKPILTPKAPSLLNDDRSTADELSPIPENNYENMVASAPKALPVKSKRGLGTIGGKKKSAVPPPPESETRPELQTDAEVEVPLPLAALQPKERSKAKKGKLGQIGGKKKQTESTAQPAEALTEPEASTPVLAPTKSRIVGPEAHKPSHKVEGEKDGSRSRTPIKSETEVTTEPRETSLERADRKRSQLKRDLEAKAKASVKKKRKF